MILKKPKILLADEPTASLDPKTSAEIIKLLLSMKSPERVIIIATHSPEIWAQVDEVIALTDFDNDEFAKEFSTTAESTK